MTRSSTVCRKALIDGFETFDKSQAWMTSGVMMIMLASFMIFSLSPCGTDPSILPMSEFWRKEVLCWHCCANRLWKSVGRRGRWTASPRLLGCIVSAPLACQVRSRSSVSHSGQFIAAAMSFVAKRACSPGFRRILPIKRYNSRSFAACARMRAAFLGRRISISCGRSKLRRRPAPSSRRSVSRISGTVACSTCFNFRRLSTPALASSLARDVAPIWVATAV